MIKQIGLPLRGRPILLIAGMITDRIELHSVLLPLQIRHKDIFIIVNRYCSFYRLRACPKESSHSPVTPLTWFRSEIYSVFHDLLL